MMQWGWSSALLLLLALPPLGGLRLRRPPRAAALPYPDLKQVPAGHSRKAWLARAVPWAAPLLALGCFVLALARPQWPDVASRIPVPARAIMLVVDVSGSMAEADLGTTRLEAAQRLARELLERRPGDAVGLVLFSSRVEAIAPPTLEHAAILQMLELAQPSAQVPDNTTNLGDALAVAFDRLRAFPAERRSVIAISDGEHNVERDAVGPVLSPAAAAELAAALGIRVHAVYLAGAPRTEEEALRHQRAESSFRELARRTGGEALSAHGGNDSSRMEAALERTEPVLVASFQYLRHRELYPGLLLLGLVVLLSGWLLGETWLRVLPAAEDA